MVFSNRTQARPRSTLRSSTASWRSVAGMMWATPGLIKQREEAGLGHRTDLVTFFDMMDVEEGRKP